MAFLHELFRYRNKYFLETGTGQGDITQLIADSGCFKTIYTLESSKELYEAAVKRFEDKKNINCFHADSKSELLYLIHDIQETMTIFLHTGDYEKELLQIREHPIKNHVFLFHITENVNTSLIVQLLKSIDSKYTFSLHDKEGIHFLAAHVDEYLPISIHKYAKKLPFPSMPPGIGDFLRGSIAMILHSQQYNYAFYMDHTSHPIFDWLEPSQFSLFYNINSETKYLLNYLDYGHIEIARDLKVAFETGNSFVCSNNAFYSYEGDKPITTLTNQKAKQIMRKILIPNAKLKSVILEIYRHLGLEPNQPYFVIHLRCGDQCLFDKHAYVPQLVDYYTAKIQFIVQNNPNIRLVLLTDSSAVGCMLKERIPSLFYTDSPRIHLGALNVEHSVIPYTLAEMFIIIHAKTILSNSRSGFSDLPSQIFDIPYHPVF